MLPAGRGSLPNIGARDEALLRAFHDIADPNHKQSRETEHLHAFVPYVGSLPPWFAWLVVVPYLTSKLDARPHYHR